MHWIYLRCIKIAKFIYISSSIQSMLILHKHALFVAFLIPPKLAAGHGGVALWGLAQLWLPRDPRRAPVNTLVGGRLEELGQRSSRSRRQSEVWSGHNHLGKSCSRPFTRQLHHQCANRHRHRRILLSYIRISLLTDLANRITYEFRS